MPTNLHTLQQHLPAESLMLATLREQGAYRPTAIARFFGASPIRTEAMPWFVGAMGERQMARGPLASLPPEWVVLHSVGVGMRGADIDHVLIGPAGVVTVNTKTHRGAKIWVAARTFMVNGQRQPYIRNSEHEAARVRRALAKTAFAQVPVIPVIAVVDAAQITRKDAPDVAVVGERGFQRWLRRLPAAPAIEAQASLGGEVTVDQILHSPADSTARAVHTLARQVGELPIWADSEFDVPGAVGSPDRGDVEQRFAQLQHEWARSRGVNRLWRVVLALGALAAIPLAFKILISLAQAAVTGQ